MIVTYVPNPNAADGMPVVAEVISLGTTLVEFAGIQPVIVMGGTVQTTVSFSGSVSTDIGNVKIEDQNENYAEMPAASTPKTGANKALIVQNVDDSGTPLREATQTSMLAAQNAANSTASLTLNNQGTQATSALQTAGNATLTTISNNQATAAGQAAGNATATAILNAAGTMATSSNQVTTNSYLLAIDTNMATAAGQTTGNNSLATIVTELNGVSTAANQVAQTATLTAILNNQGTQATSALESSAATTQIMNNQGTLATSALQQTGNAIATVIMNDMGTLATAAGQSSAVFTVIMNGQGTLATSANQTAGNTLATTGNSIATLIMNGQGTLATAAGQATANALATTGNSIATVVMNDLGTLATAAMQTSMSSTLTAILNAQGTQSPATLQPTLTVVMNDMGTLATSSAQTAQQLTLTSILNDFGTLATAAGQTTTNSLLTSISNNEGTIATSANQVTQNAYLNSLVAGQAYQATLAEQQVIATNLANVTRTYGASGTVPSNDLSVLMGLDPSAVSTDSFGRMRISSPDYRFDGQFTYNIPPDLWDSAWNSTGTVTYDSTNRVATVTCAANGTAVLQGHKYAPYTPGRSQLAFLSFTLGSTPPFGTARRVGYYDSVSGNGVYLEQNPNFINLTLASSTGNGNQVVNQSAWNIDRLDGTGPSGLTLDLTKSQILGISLQALYAGRVLVGFDINGILWPVHQFTHANKIVNPYIANASLPIHYEAQSTGSNTANLTAICGSVMSEGGGPLSDIPGRTFAAANSAGISVTTRRPILTIKSLKTFNGINNTAIVLPNTISVFCNQQPLYVELVRNATTITGASYSSVDAANSTIQYDTSATAITGGSVVFATLIASASAFQLPISENLLNRLVLTYSQLLNSADTLTLMATSTAGASTTYGCIVWKEIR